MKFNTYTIFLLLILLVGCSIPVDKENGQKEVDSFIYVKDKYDICYAMAHISWNSQITTTVPCDKVNL